MRHESRCRQGERYITAREVARAGRAVAGHDPALLPRGTDPGPAAAGADPAGALPVERGRGGVQRDRRPGGRRRAAGVDGAARRAGRRDARSAGRSSARRSGLWAIRYRDALGRRPQQTGFRTKGEAREALEEELRRVRLGPLYRPNATLRELDDAYLEQYDAAPSTVAFLKDNMKPALESVRRRADRRAAGRPDRGVAGERCRRASATARMRALRQVLAAAVRWKWIEDNPAALVKNPEPKPGEIDPFEVWEEIDAIAAELDEVARPAGGRSCAGTGVRPGGGVRRRVARRRPRAARCSWSGARTRRAG